MFNVKIGNKKPLVLVSADDGKIRNEARAALEKSDYAVALAAHGSETVECFGRLRPDLVLLDVAMPELEGFETCRELRRERPDDATPIVIVTHSLDEASIDRAYEVGATDFIAKPVNWLLLSHRLRSLLRASHAIANLRENQTSLANAQRIARLGSWEWDTETNQMQWSDEVYRIFGLVPDDKPQTYDSFWNAVHPEDRDSARDRVEEGLRKSKHFAVEHRLQRPDGSERFVEQQGELVRDDRRRAGTWVCGTVQDVTEQRYSQEQIRYLANYDSLTGLANRRLFKERLARAIEQARKRNFLVALLYMDLDRFKRINDTLGHSAGDELLRSVAERLSDQVRSGGDLVGRVAVPEAEPAVSRLGGDEFTILLSSISQPEDAAEVARRILDSLPSPVSIDGHKVSTTGSIGIAIYPLDGEDVETLVKHADTAMYHAKNRGLNSFAFFDSTMNAAVLRKLMLESRLRDAVDRNELRLEYQPRVDMRTGKVIGMEALLRWQHPELGTVSPREFIPLCEESGLIVPIGEWALRAACRQNAEWHAQGYEPLVVSVNVSARQIALKDLRETVSSALQVTGFDPHCLEIEITESMALQDDEETASVLREVRSMGVRIALDDFGAGYSSLRYFTRLPLDTLKLDRCLVRDLGSDPAAASVASAVIAMAHSLGLQAVAEGVDAEEQATILRDCDCDEMQGFLFSGAVSAEDFVRFLRRASDGDDG